MSAISTDKDGNVNLKSGAKFKVGGTEGTVVAAEATANATDLATAQALANALKTKLNDVIAELKTKGLLKT